MSTSCSTTPFKLAWTLSCLLQIMPGCLVSNESQRYHSAVNQRLTCAQLLQKGNEALASLPGPVLQHVSDLYCVPSQALSVFEYADKAHVMPCSICSKRNIVNRHVVHAVSSRAVSKIAHNAERNVAAGQTCPRQFVESIQVTITPSKDLPCSKGSIPQRATH